MVVILHFRVVLSLSIAHADPWACLCDGAKQRTYMQLFAHADRTVRRLNVECINISSGTHRELIRFRLRCAYIELSTEHVEHTEDVVAINFSVGSLACRLLKHNEV